MKKILTREEALLKMADLCARSEQCSFDISRKLLSRGLSSSDIRYVVGELESGGFIDDFRFARSFARDKVRFSAWGRIKIRVALIGRRIPASVITAALQEIDEDDYADALRRTALQKSRQLDISIYEDRVRLFRHLVSRGFESSLATAEVKKLASC